VEVPAIPVAESKRGLVNKKQKTQEEKKLTISPTDDVEGAKH